MFGYRLAALLGVWHPDHLADHLTAAQWCGWEQYYEQDPWGEDRQDLRAAANTLFALGDCQDIQLMHPYITDSAEAYEKHKEMEARQKDPALQAKLKAAREKHIAEMKNRGAR